MTIKRHEQLRSSEAANNNKIIESNFVNPVTTPSHLSHNRTLLFPFAAIACLAIAVGAMIAAFLNVNEGNYASAAWSVVIYAIAALGACWFYQGENA